MIEQIQRKWLDKIASNGHSSSLTLLQQQQISSTILNAVLQSEKELYYVLPEIIDFVERNQVPPDEFIEALFLLRDEIINHSVNLTLQGVELKTALHMLQEIIVKVGSYFSHLRMDLNISQKNVSYVSYDRVEGNILELDENFLIRKTNSSLLKIFGYEKEEVIGRPLQMLFSNSSQTLLRNSLSSLKRKLRLKIDLEVEALHKFGERFQVILKISRKNIYDEPAVYHAYIQNVSYIKETKDTLNLLSMALESAGEGIFILDAHQEGKVLFVNEAIESIVGTSRKNLLGKPFAVLRGGAVNGTWERRVLQKSIQSGWEGEQIFRNHLGQEYFVHLHTRPVQNEYGETVAIVGIIRDVTEAKKRESRILELQKFVENIINNLPHFVIVTDENLNIRLWNLSLERASRISGAEAVGKNIFEVFPQLAKTIPYEELLQLQEGLSVYSKKVLMSLNGEEDSYYQILINPIQIDSQRQLVWSILDITKEELLKIRITWQNARLKFLEKFAQLLNSNLDIQSIFQRLGQELREVIRLKGLVFLLPLDLKDYKFNLFYLSLDTEEQFPLGEVLDLSQCTVLPDLIKEKRPIVEDDHWDEGSIIYKYVERFFPVEHIQKIVHFPVHFENEIVGILSLIVDAELISQQNDIDFLQNITSHLAIALKNSFYFKLIELQNKKLNIINQIFNIPQSAANLGTIYQSTLKSLSELLQTDQVAFWYSDSGEEWHLLTSLDDWLKDYADTPFPVQMEIDKTTIFTWDESHSFPVSSFQEILSRQPVISSCYHSGTKGYFAFTAFGVQLIRGVDSEAVLNVIDEVMKQLIISVDQINLFEKIKQAEEEWELTFNTVRIGLAVVDRNLTIQRTNQAFLDIFRMKPEEVLGKNCRELQFFNIFPEKLDYQKWKTQSYLMQDVEFYDVRLEKAILRSFYPLWDSGERFLGGVMSFYDITEHRQQEEEIKFLSRFPETNPNLVISLDPNGDILYSNPAVEKLLQKLNLEPDDVFQLLPNDYREVISGKIHFDQFPVERIHRFGERVFQYFIHQPKDDNNFYFYGIEITEKEELHKQLIQTERIRAVGEMAAGIAHDFNNLLATIIGRTQLLLLKLEGHPIYDELKIIEKAAMEGGQIVRRLQEVTRERKSKNLVPLHVIELIKESIIFTANKLKMSTQLEGKPVQLHTDFRDNVVVKADPVELKEVFTNLLLNAYDAMPNGGDLYISCRRLDINQGEAEIVIEDTGVGMSEEVRNKIFNPFFTTKGDKGTGLGLSIVYKTITSLGGTIQVESARGKGTKFIIHLPETKEQVVEKDQRRSAVYKNLEQLRLLIVDDEPELLETMAEILRLKFRTVDIAGDGYTAIEKVEKQEFDVVLSDLGMPEMSGWELADRVKKLRSDCKIILVTGWGEQAKHELKHHPAVDDILPKPYELSDLLNKINSFFQE